MRALPLLLALALAAALAQPTLRALRAGGHTRANYRARALACPFGVLIPAAALIALAPIVLIERLAHTAILYPRLTPAAVYALGVACLGLIDDTLGGAAAHAPGPRGWREHARATLRGELSTGALKAAGSLGLALLALNLLDLRPGRAFKALLVLGAGLTIGTRELRPLWTLGLFAGPALIAGVYDLREQALLGDTGANLLGALAGLWLVLSLGRTGQLIALALLLALTVYGELRSISALVERVPLLRRLDSLGRPSRAMR